MSSSSVVFLPSSLGQSITQQLWLPLQHCIASLLADNYTGWVMSVRQVVAPYQLGLVVNQLPCSYVREDDLLEQIRNYLELGPGSQVAIEPVAGQPNEYHVRWLLAGQEELLHLWLVPNPRTQSWQANSRFG